MYTLSNLHSFIPTFIEITDGLCHDVNILDLIEAEPKAVNVLDVGCVDYERPNKIHQKRYFLQQRQEPTWHVKDSTATLSIKEQSTL